jgi:hypothetical protein
MPDIPEVRARISQEFFGFLDEFEAGLQGQVRGRVSPEYLRTVLGAPPASFVPLALTCEGVDAAVALLPPERALDLWSRLFVRRYVETPIVGGLLEMWIRLFGLSPASLVRMVPRAFAGNYRHFASVRVGELGRSRAVLAFGEVTPVLFEHPGYYSLAMRGVFEGALVLCRETGSVRVEADPTGRTLRFEVAWGTTAAAPATGLARDGGGG